MNDDGAKAELDALRRELQETREALTREHTRVLRLEEVMANQGGDPVPAAAPVPEHLVSTLEDLTRAVERMAEERRETRRSLQEITRAITASELRPVQPGTTSRTTAPAVVPVPAPAIAAEPQAVRRRLGAVIAAAALAAVLLVWAAVALLVPVADEAVVNARIVWVQAPIDGVLRPAAIPAGRALGAGESLAEVVNPSVDAAPIARAEQDQRAAATRRSALEGELDRIESQRIEAAAALRRARDEAAAELERQVPAEEARRATLVAAVATAPEGAARAAAQSALAEQEARIVRLRQDRAGILADRWPTGTAPAEQARADELARRIQDLHARIAEAERAAREADARLAEERRRIERLSRSPVTAPVAGPVWRAANGGGSPVVAGDRVAAVADASSIAIDAWIQPRHAERIAVGDRALVVVPGRARPVAATVRLVQDGAGADADAAVAGPADPTLVRLALVLDDSTVAQAAVGRNARVRIVPADQGALTGMASALYRLFAF